MTKQFDFAQNDWVRPSRAVSTARDFFGWLASTSLVLTPAGPGRAQDVQADGRTATGVVTVGSVTDVTTATISQGYGVNSFSRLGVASGATVNIHAPGGTRGTVNVVTGGRSVVNGALHGMHNGTVGGELYIANPDGFTVGPGGKILGGRIGLSTPTHGFAEGLVGGDGQVSADHVGAIAEGRDPQGAGDMDIAGRIAAGQSVRLRTGGGIALDGEITAGERADLMAGAVNMGVTGEISVQAGGGLRLGAAARVIAGAAEDGGRIDLRARGDIALDWGAVVGAEGMAQGAGGNVVLFADGSAHLGRGAVVSAAALGDGAGGFVEFSARDKVLLEGELRAWSAMGQGGSVLIDPAEITIAADVFQFNADYSAVASERIVVAEGVTISTRNIGAGTDHLLDDSVGDSANLTLEAPEIVVERGARLLAHATGSHVGGDITLDAHVIDTVDLSTSALPSGQARITVIGAVIHGRDVRFRTRVIKDNILSTAGMINDYVSDTFGSTGIGMIDNFIAAQVGRADASVTAMLAALDAANLPAFLGAEARTQVAGSYIMADRDAVFSSRAETLVTLAPADRALAVVLHKSSAIAETLLQSNQVETGRDLNVTATAREFTRLAAGSDDPDAASNMALAISGRAAEARALLLGSTFSLPPVDGLTRTDFIATVAGEADVRATVAKDIEISATSGGNESGAGEAVIVSVEDSFANAAVTGFVRTDDGDLNIAAETVYDRYDLAATVDEDSLGLPAAAPGGAVDDLAQTLAGARAALAAGLGGLLDGAALILDRSETETLATFGGDTPYTSLTSGFDLSGTGGLFRAMPDPADPASEDTTLRISALTDLGDSALSATVGTAGDEGRSRGGTAILSDQTRKTNALHFFSMMETAPALDLSATLTGSYAMTQDSIGGARTALSYGSLVTDYATEALLTGYFGGGMGALTIRASEALQLLNRQAADHFAQGAAGTLGFARTDYASDVTARMANSFFDENGPGALTIEADSASDIDTVAVRNGTAQEDRLMGAAATALVVSSGQVRASVDDFGWIESDQLSLTARDATARQIVANASADGDGTNLLGALAYDEYRRDTIAEILDVSLLSLAEGVTIAALSESSAGLVSIGRASGDGGLGLAGLGAWLVDDHDVIARLDGGLEEIALAGDLDIAASRTDKYILVQGTEASSGTGAGVGAGLVLLGGDTRAEALFERFVPDFEEGYEPETWELEEFAPATLSTGGDVTITATNAVTAFDLTMGGGSADSFGGMGSLAYIDMGHLAEDRAIAGVTDALLDGGSVRAAYAAETDAVRAGFAADFNAAGAFGGGGLAPETRRASLTAARLEVTGGEMTVNGAISIEARDARRAAAVAGQLQNGLVASAADAFTTYFSIDDISESGVSLSLRPDSIGEAVTTATLVYATGRKAFDALSDFSDAIAGGASISTDATTFGAAAGVTVIGGSVLAEIDLSGAGALNAGTVSVDTVNEATAAALGFGMQVGANSIGASVSHGRLNQLGLARIMGGAVTAASTQVSAATTGRATVIGGIALAGTGQAAVGGTITLADLDAAALAEVTDSIITTSGRQTVAATDDSNALSLALAGGGSPGAAAVIGAIGATSQRALTRAAVLEASLVSGGRIEITADQAAITNALVAQVGGAGNVAAGAAISDVTLRGATEALVADATLDASGAGRDIRVGATSERSIGAAAVGANVGTGIGATGSISLVTREDAVRARVLASDLAAEDSILVEALADADHGALGGGGEGLLSKLGAANLNLAGGGTAGIGVSVSVIRSLATVEALVSDDSALVSNGAADGNGIAGARRGAADGFAERLATTWHGIAVVADSETHMDVLSTSASAAGTAAISVQVPVLILRDAVRALISGGSADSVTDVVVSAANRPVMRLLSMIAQGSGAVAGGVDIETVTLAGIAEARIEDATLTAGRDAEIAALSPEEISTWSAAFSAGGQVAVAGVVQAILAESRTEAVLDGGSITAEGDLTITATAPRGITRAAANATLSGTVGVGGTVMQMLARDTVTAQVADSSAADRTLIDVDGAVDIAATGALETGSVVVSGSGGLVAIAGSVLVARTQQKVLARLGDHAQLQPGRANTLSVTARQDLVQNATVGNISGGGAAIGAAILSLSGSNNVLAEIGDQADAHASGAITVSARAHRDITGTSAAIGGGGLAFQGSATILRFGEVSAVTGDPGRPNADDAGAEGTLVEVDGEMGDEDALNYGAGDGASNAALAEARGARQALAAARALVAPDGVTARVGVNAELIAQGQIDVTATETGALDAASGGLALGTGALTAGFTQLRLGTEVAVDLAAGARLVSPGGIAARAVSEVETGTPRTLAGSGGALAGVGAITETHADRRVTLSLGAGARLDTFQQDGALIALEARETGAADADADGAALGAIAVGGVFATARNSSLVQIAAPSAELLGYDIDIAATRAGSVSATGFGIAGGVVSGAGVDVAAHDASQTRIDLGASDIEATGAVTVSATARSDVAAVATGAAVSLLGSVGGSLAKVVRVSSVDLLADGLTLDASRVDLTTLDAESQAGIGASTLNARTVSASGGAASLGISKTTLENDSTVRMALTLGALDVSGDMTVLAATNATMTATSTGLNLGLVAAGANLVEADSDASATLDIALAGTGSVNGTLALEAGLADVAALDSVSGSGAIYAAQAARSDLAIGGDLALTLDGGAGLIIGGALDAQTVRAVTFENLSTSFKASLAGFGGSKIDNDIDANSALTLRGAITADAFDAGILTDIGKNDPGYSGTIGSAGLLDGTSLLSETDVDVTARLEIADGATLTETGAAEWYDVDSVFTVSGVYDLFDSVKIDTGGGIAVPSAKTMIEVDADDMTIRVGDATLTAEAGIAFSVLSDVEIGTEAFVNVYGLAGSPYAEAISDYDATQLIDLAEGAALRSNKGSVRLNAGSGEGGGQTADVSSELRVWNATALPIGRAPFAQSRNTQDNLITLAGGAELRAANDVVLVTGAGSRDTYSYGLASDLYREAAESVVNALGDVVGADDVSFDTEVGEVVETAANSVTVDGEAGSGTNYFQQLIAGSAGITTVTEGIDAEIVPGADIRGTLEAALAALEADLANAYSDPLLVARLESEMARLASISTAWAPERSAS